MKNANSIGQKKTLFLLDNFETLVEFMYTHMFSSTKQLCTVVRVRTKQTGDKMWMEDGWRNIDTTKFINFLFYTIKKGIEHSKLFLDDDSVLTNLKMDFIWFCQWKDI